MLPHSHEVLSGTFGYHPDPRDLEALVRSAEPRRVLVINGVLADAWTLGPEFRTTSQPDTPLAEGLYWFLGSGTDLVVSVLAGAPSADGIIRPRLSVQPESALGAAHGWAEHYWVAAAGVPVPVFEAGDIAVSRSSGIDAYIRSRLFAGGSWMYVVRLDGRTQSVSEAALRVSTPEGGPAAWVLEAPSPVARFGATLTRGKLDRAFTNTVFSFRATRTSFRPYQFKPVLKLLQTGGTRLLVADEVGLGKTIEAGLIWTELEARRRADRVLVVCPSSLTGKWQSEMELRFGFELTELTGDTLDAFLTRHREGRLPKRLTYMASLERLRTWDGLAELDEHPPQFDLIIVDEAHSMRNPATKSHELGERLSEWGLARVFLTATPINLGEQDLHSLLELLAPEDYGGPSDLTLRLEPNAVLHRISESLFDKSATSSDRLALVDRLAQSPFGAVVARRPEAAMLRDALTEHPLSATGVAAARRHIADLNTLSTVITRTRKVEVDDQKALRSPHTREVHWTPAEDAFYQEYLAWCSRRADQVQMPVAFAMQMPLRLASACLPAAKATVLAAEHLVVDEDQGITTPARSWVEPHAALLSAARAIPDGLDSKFDILLEVLRTFMRDGRRALLFTFSIPTLNYLERRLEPFARIAVLNGRVPKKTRSRIMGEFRAGAYDIVLANRVASEGLDFEFCSAVINYDLPWNPMEIEQRIGRIDRIGQVEQKVLIANFVNYATIDERIMDRVLRRIEIFEKSIGPLEPIIQSELKSLQTAFDFTLTPEERERRADEALAAIEMQAAGLAEVSDSSAALLLSNDVDIDGLEDDLLRSGRYVGQRELALLIDDWARTERAPALKFSPDGANVELRGTAAMADRLVQLSSTGQRTRREVEDRADALRSELPLVLMLDHDRARETGGDLLTATDPLVLAAASVPGAHHARFTHLRLTARPESPATGTFLVVLAVATTTGPHPTQEVWGEAINLSDGATASEITDLVLAALASGALAGGDSPASAERLSRFAEHAEARLLERQAAAEQREREEAILALEARTVALEEQLNRQIAAIERRRATSRARGRSMVMDRLFVAQIGRAEERHTELVGELRRQSRVSVALSPLAVCTVEVVTR